MRATSLILRSLAAVATLVGATATYPADRPIPLINGHVVSVLSGDMLNVKLESGTERVALQGIDAPDKDQPGGAEAVAALLKLVDGRDVQLAIGDQNPRQNLSIAVVYLGEVEINEIMVRQGNAWADREHMRRKDDAILCIYEEEARAVGRGLWAYSIVERIPPWEWRDRKHRESFTDYTDETAANCLATVSEAQARLRKPPESPKENNKIDTVPKQ